MKSPQRGRKQAGRDVQDQVAEVESYKQRTGTMSTRYEKRSDQTHKVFGAVTTEW